MKQYTDEQLKKELEDRGYFTRNLWTEFDVEEKLRERGLPIQNKETIQHILYQSLTNDANMEQIWFSIDIFIDESSNQSS